MTYDELMLFVLKQQKLTGNVVTCHEAGGFGFHLHRRLEELGIKNYVLQPQDWEMIRVSFWPRFRNSRARHRRGAR
jgi:hypothetical protein